jgi:hypothetical protein
VHADQPWQLANFEERLDVWIALDNPPDDVRVQVISLILTRMDDPFASARRSRVSLPLVRILVPGSIHAPQQIVFRSDWIEHEVHRVSCDSIASPGAPG